MTTMGKNNITVFAPNIDIPKNIVGNAPDEVAIQFRSLLLINWLLLFFFQLIKIVMHLINYFAYMVDKEKFYTDKIKIIIE